MNKKIKKNDRVDMLEGSMFSGIIRFSLPLMATGILQLLYNSADNIVIGKFEGHAALAAVGSNGALINLLVNICMGLAVGAGVAVAQDYGAGDHDGVSRTLHTSFLIATVGGVLLGIIGYIFAEQFLIWMLTPADVLPLATLYLRIYFLGMPASMIYNFCASILRSVGDTKRPLYFLTISGLINVVLNLVCVVGFKMGVAGVAIPTVVSQYVAMVLVLVYMIRLDDCCHLDFRRLHIWKDKLLRIVRVGLPAGLQGSVFSISNVVIQSAVNSFDSSIVMAGNTAAGQIEAFVYTAMNAVAQASLTFTSQNVGAGKIERVPKVMRLTVLTVSVVGLVMGNAAYLFGEPLLSIFMTDEAETAQAVACGLQRMRYVCAPYFLCGIMDVLVGCQRGMGLSVTPMVVSTLGACGLRIVWIATIFAVHRTLPTLYISYTVSWFVTSSVHFIFYECRYRKLRRQHRAAQPSAQ